MKYAAGFSLISDGYRAGADLATQLASIRPEVVVVFFSEHYQDQHADLVDGLRDGLGDGILICGGTGDGVYWRGGVANHGVSGLGFSSAGEVSWAASLERGVAADSLGAARKAAREAQRKLGKDPSFALVMANGSRADGTLIVEGLREELRCPCFGALAADERKFVRTGVFVDDQISEDAVFLLTASGEIPVRINAASGWCPIGERGRVTEAEGSTVRLISGKPANTFVREQIGQTVRPMDLGVVPLAEYPSDGYGHFVLRTPSGADETTGEVKLFGRIPEGAEVRVCRATMQEILDGVDTALNEAMETGFHADAAILVSCAGRKWLLNESGKEEVDRVRERLGDIPIAGLPSFGEIAPFHFSDGSYTPLQFHNVTFVICVFGS